MARLLVLSARPDQGSNRRLVEAAIALGHDAEIGDATRAVASAGGSRATLVLDRRDLLDPCPDGVLARVGNWRPESVLATLEAAVAAGVATVNPPAAIRQGRDHWATIWKLGRAGLPVPVTLSGADPECLAAAGDTVGFPLVVKQRRSRMGVGVIRCDARDHLEAVLDSLWRLGDEVVIQSWVETAGASLRLLVVGESVVAAARFQAAAGEWRSNGARGGTATAYRPDPVEIRLAVDAARVIGLGIAGVDVLPGPAGPIIGELNPTPGFLRLEQATGVDVAAAIVGHALRR
jgi:RimK family alpha-L-glutamate ligase